MLVPNPYYLVYNGAATMAGAEAVFLDATAENGFMPDLASIPRETWERAALFYLCSPANPQGTIAGIDYLKQAIDLARRYDFVLAVDECYAEIWDRAPPPGALEACAALGPGATGLFDNVVVFHSLSKRSSAAGLRSGFVAGDPALIGHFKHLRDYGGCQVPLPIQAAAAALWRDEAHVEENRARYRRKFDIAEAALAGRFGFYRPQGGFFLWLDVGDGEEAALRLWREAAVRVLPGGYTARAADGARQSRGALYPPRGRARRGDARNRLCPDRARVVARGSPGATPVLQGGRRDGGGRRAVGFRSRVQTRGRGDGQNRIDVDFRLAPGGPARRRAAAGHDATAAAGARHRADRRERAVLPRAADLLSGRSVARCRGRRAAAQLSRPPAGRWSPICCCSIFGLAAYLLPAVTIRLGLRAAAAASDAPAVSQADAAAGHARSRRGGLARSCAPTRRCRGPAA